MPDMTQAALGADQVAVVVKFVAEGASLKGQIVCPLRPGVNVAPAPMVHALARRMNAGTTLEA